MNDMADNSDIEFRLSRYLDGELRGQELQDFEKELQHSARLQDELRLYRSLNRQIDELRVKRTVDFDAQRRQIMAALERKMLLPRRTVRPLLLRPVMMSMVAAAAAVVLIVTATLVWRGAAPDTPGSAPASGSVAVMAVLPAQQPPAAKGQLYVEYFPATVEAREADLSELAAQLEPASGTVLVTFGKSRPSSASSDILFFAPSNRQGSMGDMK